MTRAPLTCVLLLTTLVASCRSTSDVRPPAQPAPPTAATTTEKPIAARAEPVEIQWVRKSAEHDAIYLQTYALATARVEQAIVSKPAGTWAVVLDADETVISNLEYQAERARLGEGFTPASWTAWVQRRAATPLPGAAAFLTRVRSLGGKIAIVTNRLVSECPDTEAVFRAQSLPYDVMLCKPDKGPSDKNPRFDAVREGDNAGGPAAARGRGVRRRQHQRLPGAVAGRAAARSRGVRGFRRAVLRAAEPDVWELAVTPVPWGQFRSPGVVPLLGVGLESGTEFPSGPTARVARGQRGTRYPIPIRPHRGGTDPATRHYLGQSRW